MDTKGREVIYISSDDDDNATAPLKPSASKPSSYYPTIRTTPQHSRQQMMLPKPEPHAYHTYQTLSYHTSNMPSSSARTKQPKPEPLGYSASSYNPTMTPSTQKRSSGGFQSSQVTATPNSSSKKRSNAAIQSSPSSSSKKRKTQHEGKSNPPEEKRARRFRPHPPQAFQDVYERATSQKFFVLERKRLGTAACPEEKVEMTGSTGNIYVVHIKQLPSCTCPHYQKGNQCKHWIWVMSRVLRAEFKYVYQLALLSEELRAIIAAAPPIEAPDAAGDRNRKPIEGDCPICYSELEEPHSDDNIVWCRAACGNNIHRHCFETWAKTKRGQDVTCPLCRSVWEGDKDVVNRIQKNRPINQDGYVNVADQLGISGVRDTSTYHRYGRYSRYYGHYDDYEENDDY